MTLESPKKSLKDMEQRMDSDNRLTVDLSSRISRPLFIEPPPYTHDPAGIRVVNHYIGMGFLMCIGGIIYSQSADSAVTIALASIASACIAGFGYFYGFRRRDNNKTDKRNQESH